MKVTATTLPCKSASETRVPSCEVNANAGVGAILGSRCCLTGWWGASCAAVGVTDASMASAKTNTVHMLSSSASQYKSRELWQGGWSLLPAEPPEQTPFHCQSRLRPRSRTAWSAGCGEFGSATSWASLLPELSLDEYCRWHGQAFSSRLSSLRKRQSAASAIILLGLDLIMPTSRSRKEKNRIVSSGS